MKPTGPETVRHTVAELVDLGRRSSRGKLVRLAARRWGIQHSEFEMRCGRFVKSPGHMIDGGLLPLSDGFRRYCVKGEWVIFQTPNCGWIEQAMTCQKLRILRRSRSHATASCGWTGRPSSPSRSLIAADDGRDRRPVYPVDFGEFPLQGAAAEAPNYLSLHVIRKPHLLLLHAPSLPSPRSACNLHALAPEHPRQLAGRVR